MSLRDKIDEDLKGAMRAKDEIKVSTLRLLRVALKNAEIEAKAELDDRRMLEVIGREASRRKEAIESYNKGGRGELAEKEKKELEILKNYLPEQLSDGKIKEVVDEVIAQVDASGPGDFGKVMGVVMGRVKGQVSLAVFI